MTSQAAEGNDVSDRDARPGTGVAMLRVSAALSDPWATTLTVVLAVATVARVWLAVTDHGVFWPDEIFQSVEQAHRVVFGNGLVPWEFRDGARSWIYPGALAALMAVASALGVSSGLGLVIVVRLAMVAGSVASLWLAARLAREAGRVAALVAASTLAILPTALLFQHRTMTETASAPLVLLSFVLLSKRTKRAAVVAGWAMAGACLLRYQNGVFALVLAVALPLERRWRAALEFTGAGVLGGLVGGLVDGFTWGRPFHSLASYVDFNLMRSGATTFGTESVWFYFEKLAASGGVLGVMVMLLALAGCGLRPVMGCAALAYTLAHLAVPHKEVRFLVPVLPLYCVLAGGAVEWLWRRERGAAWAVPAAVLAAGTLVSLAAVKLFDLRFRDFGLHAGTERETQRVWGFESGVNYLLSQAGEQADVCGVAAVGTRAAFTGGYSYLHRDVPLFYQAELCGLAAHANYVLTPQGASAPPGFERLHSRGGFSLFHRAGTCEPVSYYDPTLEGAYDMGLGQKVARGSGRGVVSVDLVRDGGTFLTGWGGGERMDCQPGRWAASRQAVALIELDAPPAAPMELQITLRAYSDNGQRVSVALNDRVVQRRELPAAPTRLRAELQPGALTAGVNRLRFDFAVTDRPGGNDTRDLAALFREIRLVPRADDFLVQPGTAADRPHLVRGFSGDEHGGQRPFAWSLGPESEVVGTLVHPEQPHVLQVVGRSIPYADSQATAVELNGRQVGTLEFRKSEASHGLLVPATFVRAGENRLVFRYEETVSPAAADPDSSDERALAVLFRSLHLFPVTPTAELDLGTVNAQRSQLAGWSRSEREGERTVAWAVGKRSSVLLAPREASVTTRELWLELRAYAPALPLQVSLAVDGKRVGNVEPTDQWQTHVVALKEALRETGSVVSLTFDHTARPAEFEAGSRDRRELSVRVSKMGVR